MGVSTFLKTCGLSLAFCFILAKGMASSATDHFRSRQDGLFNTALTWESSVDKNTWVLADLVPGTASKSITIRNGNTVTANTNLTIDDVFVENGGTFVVNPSITITIANGVAQTDFLVSGILRNAGVVTATGKLVFANLGVYQHNFTTTEGYVPIATWLDGSVCQITGYTTSNTGPRFYQPFTDIYRFIWNCPNQTGVPALTQPLAIRDEFKVESTGIGILRLFYSTGSVNHNIKNYFQTGGIVDAFFSTANPNLFTTINITGNFSLLGGAFRKGSANSSNKANVIFKGSTQNFTKSPIASLSGELNFELAPNTTVDFNNSLLSGSTGTFTAQPGSTLITANSGGFALTGATGTIQSTGTRTYSTAANYTYNGTTQNTGTGLPTTVNNLTIDNNSIVTLRPGNLNVTGALAITTGSLDLGTNLLTTPGSIGFTGAGTLFTQNTTATPLASGKTWEGTVAYNSASSQAIVNGNYNSLNGTGGARVLGSSINIAGAFTPGVPASYTTTGSTVNFNGAGAQNIPAFDFNNLSASTSGVKTVSGNATVLNTLNVTGATVLNANGNLTLLATATKNANVAPLTGSADIIGNVKVQSYLYGEPSGAKRGTKSMSSPINDAAVVGAKTFQQLKNDVVITGPGGVSNGFDASATSRNTVVLNFYNEPATPTATSFIPVPTITTNTSPGTGFLFFYIGNRSNMYANPGKIYPNLANPSNPFPAAEDKLVTYNGPINKGDININIGFTSYGDAYDGFYLAGNPYPSTIDWDAVRTASTNLGSSITIVTGGKANATYNAAGGISANGGSRYIQPGQGFYIQSNSGGGILRFRENQKNTVSEPSRLLAVPNQPVLTNKLMASKVVSNSVNFASTNVSSNVNASATQRNVLRIKLASNDFEEETVVLFDDQFVSEANENDSKYFPGFDVSLATLSSDNKPMAINLMPDIAAVDEVKLSVTAKQSRDMTLNFTDVALGQSKVVWLEDRYLNNLVEVTQGMVYAFSVDKSVATSFGDNRFKLLLDPPKTLPIQLIDFSVKKTNNGVLATWNTKNEIDNKGFELERATDNENNFVKISAIAAKANPQTVNNYSYEDKSPLIGNNYYRLKQLDKDGKFVYSNIKSVVFDFNKGTESLRIYPNPASDFIFVNIAPISTSSLHLRITSTNGTVVKEGDFKQGESIKADVSKFPTGVYIVEITEDGGQVLGTSKFMKK